MRREELFDILGQIDDRFILPARRDRRNIPWENYLGVAAALCVIVASVWTLTHVGYHGGGQLPANPTDPTPSAATAPSAPTDESTEATQPRVETSAPTEAQPPAAHPPYSELRVFIYTGEDPFYWVKPNVSECSTGHLYFYHEKSGEISPICDEPVICFGDNNVGLYFVKEAEPTRLYCAPLTDLTQHAVVYTSNFGPINDIYAGAVGAYANVIIMTENNKRGVLMDLITGESEVFIEQYYIEVTTIEDLMETDEKRTYNKVWFRGKCNEEDALKDYLYYLDTGEVIESPY